MTPKVGANGGPRVAIDSPLTEGVFGNLAEFASDATSLAELQTQLALLDLKASAAKATIPAGLTAAGLGLATAALPVLLLAVGELLVQYTQLTRGWSYMIVALVALVLGGALAAIFAGRLGKAFDSFQRSREELARNVAWIKTVLAYSGRGRSRTRP